MPDKNIVLIVEDELNIAKLLETNLELDGYETILCSTGKEALQRISNRHIDIILLDVMLPDSNGTDVCRKIKHSRPDIKILMISALGQSSDRIKGLKSGADDYLPKPFDLEELSLRMENLLTRKKSINTVSGILQVGVAQIDFEKQTLKRGSKMYVLTPKEGLLLKYMVERKGEILSRQHILDEVWGFEHYPNTRTIDNFIANFRKYIEEDPSKPQVITTVRGIGYRLNPD